MAFLGEISDDHPRSPGQNVAGAKVGVQLIKEQVAGCLNRRRRIKVGGPAGPAGSTQRAQPPSAKASAAENSGPPKLQRRPAVPPYPKTTPGWSPCGATWKFGVRGL